MHLIVPLVTAVASTVTACSLLCYRRGSSRYRFWKSALAYALIVCSGGQAIDILVNGAVVTPWDAALSVVIAVMSVRARGNVACFVRVAHD